MADIETDSIIRKEAIQKNFQLSDFPNNMRLSGNIWEFFLPEKMFLTNFHLDLKH